MENFTWKVLAVNCSNSTIFALANFSSSLSGTTIVWTTAYIINFVIKLSALLINATLLILFLKCKSTRTPFNVYLFNLSFANTAHVFFYYSLTLINDFVHFRGPPPHALCIAFRSSNQLFSVGITNSHFLSSLSTVSGQLSVLFRTVITTKDPRSDDRFYYA
ncbi:hypothetical protein RvY_08446 [Ramazzottius varieornatus]|uniref:G-protein coupled receptors family 1 profile domain-containing protein n=1 Tax=Ramazzottius varieornatus TaxID=947166 RepID=A0A1D1V5W6_RAMVA|nr:hypothetical protein RvY_08446 [Ramazzottius varieornatus]